MAYYSKLAAALIGLAIILAGRYGIDLEGTQGLITDAIGAILTAVGVWLAKNKPTTTAQVVEARAIASEGAKEVRKEVSGA